MKSFSLSGRQLAATLCVAVGLMVMGFVLSRHQAWLRMLPNSSPPVFNVGLLSLISARIVWDAHRHQDQLTRLAALVLVLLPAAVLAQTLLGIDLRIDWPAIHQAFGDTGHPGRLAPNTCVAFICYGLAVALIQGRRSARSRGTRILIGMLLTGGLLLGLSALAGYLLDLEGLYRLMDYNKMSAVTSVVLVTIGGSVWIALIRLEPPKRYEQQENRITATAVAVLSVVAVLSGMTTFAVLQAGFKESVAQESGAKAHGQAIAFAHSLAQDIESAQDVARQLDLRKLLVRLEAQPHNPAALAELREVVESFSVYDFNAVAIYLSNGHPLVEQGQMRQGQAEVRLPIEGEFTTLLWDNGLILRTRTDVVHQGRAVGVMIGEMRLHALTELMQELQRAGRTSDLLLCSRVGEHAACMPSRFYAANQHIDMGPRGAPVPPIARALMGEAGVDIVKDLRGQRVQSGYAQLGTFNLGMEVKTDIDELYAPLKARLNIVFGVVVMFVVLGTWLLRSRVHPLAERVMADQRRMQADQALLADKEKRLRDVTNNIPAMIGHFDVDQVCTFANDRGLKALGVRRDQVPGITMRAALGEENYLQHQPGIRDALAGRYAMLEGRGPHNGGTAYYQAHMVPDRDRDGGVRGFYLMTFDVTTLKEYQIALAAGEDRLRTITDNLPVLISYIDRDHRFQFANGTFREWLNVEPSDVVGRPVMEVVGPELYVERRAQIDRALAGERVEFEMHSVTQGVLRHLQTSYLPDRRPDGSVPGIYTLSTDVTVLKNAEQRMRQLARYDALTGLPNRLQFEEKLPEAMARCTRARKPMALMFLDVDRFKSINDTLGHAAGDDVLREFAQRLTACVRKTDTVARLAGDEFVVILEGLNSIEEPQFVARKIIAVIGGDFDVAGRALAVSTSLGIALYEGGDTSPARLLSQADEALYEAKAAGRNTFRVAARQV